MSPFQQRIAWSNYCKQTFNIISCTNPTIKSNVHVLARNVTMRRRADVEPEQRE